MKTVTKKVPANSKATKQAIQAHILECVTNDNEMHFDTVEEAIKWIASEFDRVANYANNIKRVPNNQERFSDYLNGLPFDFFYYYGDIKDFLNSLGINSQGKEYTDEQSAKLYHYLIYKEVYKAL